MSIWKRARSLRAWRSRIRNYQLSPGMYVSLDFTGPAGEPQLVVPSEAVIATGERTVVIVAREGGGFDVVDVIVGTEQGGRSTILSGSQRRPIRRRVGQFLIDSEASLKSTLNRLKAMSHPHRQRRSRSRDRAPHPLVDR